MVKKDKWVTYPDVAREAEKLILSGVPEDKINGSMIWNSLQYGSRHSAYKFLEEWRDQRGRKKTLPPFALTDDMRDRLISMISTILGEALLGERQSMASEVDAKDFKIAILNDSSSSLMETLAVTEQERDKALRQLEEVSIAHKDQVATIAKLEAALEALKAEYDRLFDRQNPVEDENQS